MSHNTSQAWETTCKELSARSEFKDWIKQLEFNSFSESVLSITATSQFVKDWVESNLMHAILTNLRSHGINIQSIEILIKKTSLPEKKTTQKEDSIDPRFTFENFVVGKPNEFAYAAAMRVSESTKILFNPLFLYGGVGLGKTHLMHAIAWHIKSQHQKKKIVYLSAEKFMYKFVKAIRCKETVAFKDEFRNIDVLMVDDVQFFGKVDATQEEFFHTFNDLIDNNRQIILSADKSPSDLDNIAARLRSRMGCGLVADIHPTTYELRLGFLQNKVEKLDLKVPNKVMEFLACKITSNIRELEGALNRIIAHSALMGRAVDVDSTQTILKDILRSCNRHLSIDEIKQRVAEFFGVKYSDMSSSKRLKNIVRPRQVAMYLCKELTSQSFPEIAREFGGKDHTTILYAVTKVKEVMNIDSKFSKDVEILRKSLQNYH